MAADRPACGHGGAAAIPPLPPPSELAMCHLVFFSTDCPDDFLDSPRENFHIERPSDTDLASIGHLLQHANVWYMGCRYGGCSCHFRNLLAESDSLGLGPPEEWFEEDPEDFGPTIAAFQFFCDIVRHGFNLDVVDVWDGCFPAEADILEVSASKLPPTHFRFIQDTRFDFRP